MAAGTEEITWLLVTWTLAKYQANKVFSALVTVTFAPDDQRDPPHQIFMFADMAAFRYH